MKNTLLFPYSANIVERLLTVNMKNSEADPGFFLGGGAPLTD